MEENKKSALPKKIHEFPSTETLSPLSLRAR